MNHQEDLLACVEIEPAQPALRSLIWLHGLGADGHDFEPIVPELGLAPELRVRVVLPHAPQIPVSINGGMLMPAWYDIRDLELAKRHDEEGVRRSAEQLTRLIERENERGVASENIVLAGFSQGGAVALHVAVRHPEKLAGLIMLSTYAVLEQTIEAERSAANEGLSIFQAHGTQDPMVVLERGQAAREQLEKLGHPVEWHDYPMAHQVCYEEIRDLSAWLNARFQH
ncbi:MAG: alpha/beta fold hydrolase [Planctomycetota bacterium]